MPVGQLTPAVSFCIKFYIEITKAFQIVCQKLKTKPENKSNGGDCAITRTACRVPPTDTSTQRGHRWRRGRGHFRWLRWGRRVWVRAGGRAQGPLRRQGG